MAETGGSYGIFGIGFGMVKICGYYGISGEGRITYGARVARIDGCCGISDVGFDRVKGGDSSGSSNKLKLKMKMVKMKMLGGENAGSSNYWIEHLMEKNRHIVDPR